ncbi:MAG TPA: glycosyltransferase family 4 protein [Thermoanaerobaculia bacterium]|nr:glycosyltransferase family 4 protein [Thermoanaerobaculia bacterium]
MTASRLTPANSRAERSLEIVVLASYPNTVAATRYRIAQYVPFLAKSGLRVSLFPFLDAKQFQHLYDRRRWMRNVVSIAVGLLRRLLLLPRLAAADVVFVHREAMLLGPPIFEWLAHRIFRRPLALDLDDATFVEQASLTYGGLATRLKWRGKTDRLIEYADVVICGSELIAAHARQRGKTAVIVLPTIVDTELFHPPQVRVSRDVPLVGWIGSHSSYPYFEAIIPILERLARTHRFRVRIVGSGREVVTIRGVEVENVRWAPEREAEDFRLLDIGVYPLPANDAFVAGKSGLKAVEYLATGIPYVADPIGIAAALGEAGRTHLLVTSEAQWFEALSLLLRDPLKRKLMGEAGREYALKHFRLPEFASRIAAALHACSRRDSMWTGQKKEGGPPQSSIDEVRRFRD